MEVVIFEEHYEVLPFWRRREVRGRTLIQFDAHLDLQVVNADRIAALEACADADALARLGKPHHLLPDEGYGYGIEDFLHPAHRLGIFDRLVWVAPPFVTSDLSQEIFEHIEQMDGVAPEDLTGFERDRAGVLRGSLLGIDLTVCRYTELADLDLPPDSLVDFDADYFVRVPDDVPWVDPERVYETITSLDLEPEWITITRSVSSGYMPLRHRFIADYLAALFRGAADDAAHFRGLFALDGRLHAAGAESALADLRALSRQRPDCAATRHLLALADPHSENAAEARARAADLCTAYRPDVLREACEPRSRLLDLDALAVDRLESKLAEAIESREPAREIALTHAALALLYCAGGLLAPAIAHYEEAVSALGPHPEVAMEIARLLLDSPRPEEAIPLLEVAMRDDKSRGAAHHMIGVVLAERGALAEALEHLEDAHRIAPAWGEVTLALASVHEALGNEERCTSLRERQRVQHSRVRELARAAAR